VTNENEDDWANTPLFPDYPHPFPANVRFLASMSRST
jgi:hypothetical protein